MEDNWGSKVTPEYVEGCTKPWNMPMLSVRTPAPDKRTIYNTHWKVLGVHVIDGVTVLYGSRYENNENNFFMVSSSSVWVLSWILGE